MRKLLFLLFIKSWRLISVTGLGKIPGAGRFYNCVYSKLNPRCILLININGFKNKMYVNTADIGFIPMLLRYGTLQVEQYKIKVFTQIVKKGMVIADIGANIGYYTLIAARLVGKNGIVYAFEPAPNNYKLLCKNIRASGYLNVVPLQKALSNKQEKLKLYVSDAEMAGHSFSMNTRLNSLKNLDDQINSVEVEAVTLDEYYMNVIKNTRIDILKINIEGAEELALDGANKILTNSNPKILIEFWPYALKNLGTDPVKLLHKLRKYGFKIQFIDEKKQSLEPIEKIEKFCEVANILNRAPNLLLER
ncbi:MAG: FkbM family methyltransferase [Planctomycetes bacterium]|nr:FkbM family methyltransferase [Planctomycetota bacterium]